VAFESDSVKRGVFHDTVDISYYSYSVGGFGDHVNEAFGGIHQILALDFDIRYWIAGLEAALRPARMEGETLSPSILPHRDSRGLRLSR